MREFRAWDKRQNVMRYDITGFECDNGLIEGVFLDGDYYSLTGSTGHKQALLMNYTGLKDKNGNKIFEGDRIQDEEHFYYTVYWSSTQLSWMCCGEHLADFIRCGIEIIGNIHEANK